MTRRLSWFAGFAALVAPTVHCGTAQDSTGVGNPPVTQEEQALSDDGHEAKQQADTVTILTGIPLRPLATGWPATADEAATRTSAADFVTKKCMTNTLIDATTVQHVFSDCVDPRNDLDIVSGTLRVRYEKLGVGLRVTYSTTTPIVLRLATDVTLEITVPLVLDLTPTATALDMKLQGQYSLERESKGLGKLVHDAAYRMVSDWGVGGCVAIPNASWTTTFLNPSGANLFSLSTNVSGYKRCPKARGVCPLSGGRIRYERRGRVAKDPLHEPHEFLGVTIELLGGPLARFTFDDGKSRIKETTRDDILRCKP